MFNYLEQLRKKPLAFRKRVLLVTTCTLTGIIALVWISTFNVRLDTSETDIAVIENQLKPIEEIKTNIGGLIDAIKTMSAGVFGSGATTSSVQTTQ